MGTRMIARTSSAIEAPAAERPGLHDPRNHLCNGPAEDHAEPEQKSGGQPIVIAVPDDHHEQEESEVASLPSGIPKELDS